MSEHSAHLISLPIGHVSHLVVAICMLVVSMLWHRQTIFESKGDRLSSSAECRIRSLEVSDTKLPADGRPTHKLTELSRHTTTFWRLDVFRLLFKITLGSKLNSCNISLLFLFWRRLLRECPFWGWVHPLSVNQIHEKAPLMINLPSNNLYVWFQGPGTVPYKRSLTVLTDYLASGWLCSKTCLATVLIRAGKLHERFSASAVFPAQNRTK